MTEFSISSGFATSVDASFIAAFDELRAALPGWRVPLPQPERRTVHNPFTGEAISGVVTRDPGPGDRPPIPERLPFSCLLLPSCECWERHYLALDLASSVAPAPTEEDWEDYIGLMWKRDLMREPLFGGLDNPGEPYSLTEVPGRLFLHLAELTNATASRLANDWMAYCPDAPAYSVISCLNALRELAQLARRERRRLYMWNIHPYYRADSGTAP